MKVIRLIIYEGDKEWIEDTLSKSLPNGIRVIKDACRIITMTLGELPSVIELYLKEYEEETT